ncbi:hypothetical protein DFJ73DRAFT_536555 [Zopfochytrium polystomum]|nr:hypothetical protein DFJ73DRAFT_536555 [Zopfochytrium polystomum]
MTRWMEICAYLSRAGAANLSFFLLDTHGLSSQVSAIHLARTPLSRSPTPTARQASATPSMPPSTPSLSAPLVYLPEAAHTRRRLVSETGSFPVCSWRPTHQNVLKRPVCSRALDPVRARHHAFSADRYPPVLLSSCFGFDSLVTLLS